LHLHLIAKEATVENKKISIVDQTIRDAHQSLWGNRMPTDMMTSIAPIMDQVGYRAIGVTGARAGVIGSRDLKESDMFHRMRALSQLIKKTPIRGSFQPWSAFGFDVEPLAVIELYVRQTFAAGVKQFWVCDYQNMIDRTTYLVKMAKDLGAEIIMAILYSASPVHTDELFAKKTAIIANMGVDAIHIEDASGVLTPERAKTLLPVIMKEAKGIRVELHGHCYVGLAPQYYVEGMQAGIRTFHTAVSPLANDSSLPSTEGTIRNARALGLEVDIDEDALKAESEHFRKEATARGMRIGVPVEFNLENFQHQLPGGMLGTMRNQLTDIKQEHRFPEILEEIKLIRKEFGYPVMATPYSQIVGAQALFNVTSGGRYKIVSDETIMYLAGIIGTIDGPVDQNVKDKILSMPKAKKFLNWKPADITIDDLRKLAPGLTDDQLLTRISDPDKEFKDKLRTLYGR
jgi:oxaloacetate decarboxylase alpha subunit